MIREIVVVVGSSIGGVRTAQALRGEGFDGRIVLVGRERELPYDKPPLSKQFLAGDWDAQRVVLLTHDETGPKPRAAVLYADATRVLCGAVTVNWPKALVQCRRLVTDAAAFDGALTNVGTAASPAVRS